MLKKMDGPAPLPTAPGPEQVDDPSPLLHSKPVRKQSDADANRAGVLFVSPESPRGRELTGKYLESFRDGVEHGDPTALRSAIEVLLLTHAPPWLTAAWRQANPQPRREEWRGFVILLVAILERRGRTRQQAFAEAGSQIERSARWVEDLFREPASRPWLKLFGMSLRRSPRRLIVRT
jgi:hypothetical protein